MILLQVPNINHKLCWSFGEQWRSRRRLTRGASSHLAAGLPRTGRARKARHLGPRYQQQQWKLWRKCECPAVKYREQRKNENKKIKCKKTKNYCVLYWIICGHVHEQYLDPIPAYCKLHVQQERKRTACTSNHKWDSSITVQGCGGCITNNICTFRVHI